MRTGHANGFKPRTIPTRIGALTLAVPQTRGVEFYPSALEEKGIRSERALKLAVAEMYVQGVSTRKAAAITEKPCGLEVNSSQVSRAARALDDELEKWRTRPLGEAPYPILDPAEHGGLRERIEAGLAAGDGVRAFHNPDITCDPYPDRTHRDPASTSARAAVAVAASDISLPTKVVASRPLFTERPAQEPSPCWWDRSHPRPRATSGRTEGDPARSSAWSTRPVA